MVPDTRIKAHLKITFPLILALLLEQLIGLTDAVFLGRVGESELGAAAIAGVSFLAVSTIGIGYSVALQAYCAQRLGEQRQARAGQAFFNALLFLVGLSIPFTVIGIVITDPLMHKLLTHADVATHATDYLVWRLVGLPVLWAGAIYRAMFVATLKPKAITIASIAMLGGNVILNQALIFGIGPIPALGITGAAMASALSEVLALGVLIYYSKKDLQGLTPMAWHLFDRPLQWRLFRLGSWMMAQEGLAFATWLFFFIAIEHISETALAASNIVRQCGSILYLFIHAFGSSTGALCAQLIGAQASDRVMPTSRQGIVLCLLGITPLVTLYLAGSQLVLGLFTPFQSIIEAATPTLWIMVLGYVVGIPSMFYNYVLAGIGQTRASAIAMLSASFVYVIYILSITHLTDSLPWVWTSDISFYIVVLGFVAYYFKTLPWQKPIEE